MTVQDLMLLMAIQENPFETTTAAKKMRELQGNIVKPGVPQTKFFIVMPLLNYSNLGLEPVDVLLEAKNLKSVIQLEEIARKHPYTAYRGRCFGQINGILMQFRVPIGTQPLVKELVKQLLEQGTISSFKYLPIGNEPRIYTSMKLEGWNQKTFTWEFDWNGWFAEKESMKPSAVGAETPSKALEWITQRDIQMMEELMRGARRKNSEIMNALRVRGETFTAQTFSRRYQRIRDECLMGYRVTFDPSSFDIYSSVLVIGTGEERYLQQLKAKMLKDSIPFESTMNVAGNKLFWFIRLQSSHLSILLSNLYSNLEQMAVYVIDYAHSRFYPVWHEAFNEKEKKWRDDRQFMLDDVLK
jgi:hypothetical protein